MIMLIVYTNYSPYMGAVEDYLLRNVIVNALEYYEFWFKEENSTYNRGNILLSSKILL